MRAHRLRHAGANPFRRPIDYVVVLLIVVATVVVYFVLWSRSDIRNTTLVTGPSTVAPVEPPTRFPPSLAEFWSAPSAATALPVVVGPTIVTADGDTVTGRDPLTGDQRWAYTRDLPLCTVGAGWEKAIAVYHRSNCNEVTELDGVSGARGSQRNGDAELGTRLLFDGTYVTTTGPTLLNTWRSDLVQTMEYGKVPDFVNPNVQPRPNCGYGSTAVYGGLIGVIERCPGEQHDRLTLYKATNKDADTPSVVFSVLTGGSGARIITFNDQYVAVVVPDPNRLVTFNAVNGQIVTSYPLDLAQGDLSGDPPGHVVPISVGPSAVYWYTGSKTIALSLVDFHPEFSVPGTLGAGTVFVGKYLVPVPDALLVLDQNTGASIGQIRVDRHGYTGPVAMTSLGPVVLEQRGPTLAALH